MSKLVALSLSIGVLGGIATFVFLQFMPDYLIWAAFIGWACYFHTGGTNDALKKTIACNLFGALCAWVAAVLLVSVMPAGALWAGVTVGLTVLVLCLGAHVAALDSIPASVYGYASVAAFLFADPAHTHLNKESLFAASPANALVAVAASMVVGAVLGMVSGKMGAALSKS